MASDIVRAVYVFIFMPSSVYLYLSHGPDFGPGMNLILRYYHSYRPKALNN